ncbi:hypothetical protein [Roseomonas sp. WA12]
MLRRAFPALLAAALPFAAARAQEAAVAEDRLALAREYVARHRATLPDLRNLALGATAGGDAASQPIRDAVDAELVTAEPAYREALAGALAEGLSAETLRAALADGSIRTALGASPNPARLVGTLNRLTFEAVTGMAERAMSRTCTPGEPCTGR